MVGPTSSLASPASLASRLPLGRDKFGSRTARCWVPNFGTNRRRIWACGMGSPRSCVWMHCHDIPSRTLEMRIEGPSRVVLRWSGGSRCYRRNRNLVPSLAGHLPTILRAKRPAEWQDCMAMGSDRHTAKAMAEFFLVIGTIPWSRSQRERTRWKGLAGLDTSAYLTYENAYGGLSDPARTWQAC